MTENEKEVLEEIKASNKYFVPIVWATSLVSIARRDGRIKDDMAVKTLIDVSFLLINIHLESYYVSL